jgi:hypothetical protein
VLVLLLVPKSTMKTLLVFFLITAVFVCANCGFVSPKPVEAVANKEVVVTPTPMPTVEKKPEFKPLIAETDAAIGKVDFANFTFPLPRGWQNATEKEVKLDNGKRPMTKETVGMMLLQVKYGDLTGDGEAEAIVVLGVITGGLTNLNIVYIVKQEGTVPRIIWTFETGDKGDGGLKDISAQNGGLNLELYGKDRYIFRQKETLKIEEDYDTPVCCPKWFTKSTYKWNGRDFAIQPKRESLDYTGKNL